MIRTINLHEHLDLSRPLSDEELRRYLQADDWFSRDAAERIATELSQFQQYMDTFDSRKGEIAGKVKSLLRVYLLLLERERGGLRNRRLASMIGSLQALKKQLEVSYRRFMQGPYRMFSYLLTSPPECAETGLVALAESLDRRLTSVIQAGTKELIAVIDRLIRSCKILRWKDYYHAQKGGHPDKKRSDGKGRETPGGHDRETGPA